MYRVTLTNEIEGEQGISNPDGWNNIKLKLSRHPKYHSLIEHIDVPIIFYGGNGIVDGGYHYIKRVIETQGINAIIVINIGISEDEGANYELFFEGNLELSDKEEYSEGSLFYKLQCPIIQKSLWSNFVNRVETPVDLLSVTDLDGNDTQVPDSIELNLLSQTIESIFRRSTTYNDNNEGLFLVDWGVDVVRQSSGSEPSEPSAYLMFGNDYKILDELTERFEYGTHIADSSPIDGERFLFRVTYGGSYRIYGQIRYTLIFDQDEPNKSIRWFYQLKLNGVLNAAVQIGNTDTFTSGTVLSDAFISNQLTFDTTVELSAGDEIYIYAELRVWDVIAAGFITTTYFSDYDSDLGSNFSPVYTNFAIIAQTVFQETTTDALLIHDVAKSIVHRVTGIPNNSFYSEILGGTIHGYDFDGCDYKYALMKGLHVRGYTFADKPFFMSFKDFWEGADPIFNLGLGYEEKPPIDEEYLAAFTIGLSLGFES